LADEHEKLITAENAKKTRKERRERELNLSTMI